MRLIALNELWAGQNKVLIYFILKNEILIFAP